MPDTGKGIKFNSMAVSNTLRAESATFCVGLSQDRGEAGRSNKIAQGHTRVWRDAKLNTYKVKQLYNNEYKFSTTYPKLIRL